MPATTSSAIHGPIGDVSATIESSMTWRSISGVRAATSWPTAAAPSATTIARRWGRSAPKRRRIQPGDAGSAGAPLSKRQRADGVHDQVRVVAPVDTGDVDVELDLVAVGILDVEAVCHGVVARTHQ